MPSSDSDARNAGSSDAAKRSSGAAQKARELLTRLAVQWQASGRAPAVAAGSGGDENFSAMVDQSPLIVWAANTVGDRTYLNSRWAEFTGRSVKQGLGSGWMESVHPEDRGMLQERLAALRAGSSLQVEYRLRRHDGVYRWVLDAVAPRFAGDGACLGQVGSILDITERKEAERSARENAERLDLAMRLAELGEWSWDAGSDAVRYSDRVAQLTGLHAGQALNRAAAHEFVHPEDRGLVAERVGRAMAARADFDLECRIRRASGDWSWLAMRGHGVYAESGALLGLRGVVQDITARKRAEQTVQAQEAELRLVSSNTPVMLSHWSREHRLLFGNRAFAERWNVRAEDLIGKSVPEVLGESAWTTIKPYVERVLAGGSVSFECEIDYAGIGKRFVRVTYTPEFEAGGEVRGYFSAVNDISDRRRAEVALRESEERLRLATQTGKVGLWDWDIVANRITWTESLYALHGVEPSTFDGSVESYLKLVHPDDLPTVQAGIQASLESDQRYELEFRILKPNGDVAWMFTNARVLREGGRPVRMLGASLDVTARKRAELALRQSEEKFRALARHAPVGIYVTDTEGACVFVNESWSAIAGLTMEEAAGAGWVTALHPDDRARVAAEWEASVRERRPFALEYRFMRADGRVMWVAGGAVDFRDSQAVVVGRVGTIADITDRKATEFALRESEKRFRTLASRAPVGIFMTNPQGETIFVNDSWCAMAGLKLEEALGNGWMQAVHPDDRARVSSGWSDAVMSGASSAAEYRFLRPDGTIAWVQGNAVQLRDGAGRITGYVGTIADFTQRKRAEMALRESEERYRRNAERLSLAVSAARLGDWVWDPLTDAIAFSPRGAEIYGVDAGRTMTRSELRELLHPDDRERARAANEQAIATRSDYDIEYRLRRPSGEWCWIAAKGRGAYAPDGRLINMIGVVQDITARKTAEEKLRGHEAQLRLISTNAPTMLVHCDVDGRYLFVNRAYAERFGLNPDAIIGRTIREVIGEPAYAAIVPYVQRVLAGEAVEFEVDLPYRMIGPRFMRASYVPDRAEDGTVRGWLAAITDLTERRRIEHALRVSEAQYRQLIEMLPVAVYTCDREGRIDLFNEAAVALWGRKPARGIDRWSGAHRAFHPDGTPIVFEHGPVAEVVREGRRILGLEAILEQPSGERRHVLANPHPIHDVNGTVIGAVNAVIDITEHKLVERNARFLNRLSQELAALSDPEQIMRQASRALGEYVGSHRCYLIEATDESSHVRVSNDWHRADAVSIGGVYRVDKLGHSKWWRALQGGVLAIDDVEVHPLTGELRAAYVPVQIRAYATAPVTREGRWVAALAITHDQPRHWREDEVTLLGNVATLVWPMIERARAEGTLQAHAQELERKVEERTASLREAIAQMEEFSYSVSHDLRSPLRAMNAYAEALIEDHAAQLDASARDYLERIKRSCRRMENLTHDVLTYSRIARAELQLSPTDVAKLVGELIDQYAELHPQVADIVIDAPHAVLAHESSLGQCLGNLLTNAAKFVRPGERPKIYVRTADVGGRVRISVQDEGIGIPPQYHTALFQVFERVPTRARYEGTGIGLAIVRKAAEKMGGRCGVESDGENGSKFWVELAKA